MNYDEIHHREPTLWEQNHGNILVIVMLAVLAIGAMILIYRQTRLVDPRLPDSSAVIPDLTADDSSMPGDQLLSIVIDGANESRGSAQLAVYDSVQWFNQPEHAALTGSVPIKDGRSVWEVPLKLLPERFAVVVFQDENADKALTRDSSGAAVERFGFSGGTVGSTDPPTFDQVSLERPTKTETITISLGN